MGFLSTLSLRRATTSQVPTWFGIPNFYPRSPCGERRSFCPADSQGRHFYPRSPCGERHARTYTGPLSHYFYPRSPCGERHFKPGHHVGHHIISIHALLAESDDSHPTRARRRRNFYPRSPCGERQQKCTKQWGTFAHMKQILWGLHLHADRQGCILPFLPLFFPYFLVRMNREFYDCLSLALSKQDSILIKIRVQTHKSRLCFCNGFPVDKSAGCPIPNRSVRSILL